MVFHKLYILNFNSFTFQKTTSIICIDLGFENYCSVQSTLAFYLIRKIEQSVSYMCNQIYVIRKDKDLNYFILHLTTKDTI